MRAIGRPHRRTRRSMSAVAAVLSGALVLAGCGTGQTGHAKRSAPQPPVHCSTTECPDLPVYSNKRLSESGVTAENAAQTVPVYLTQVLDDLDRTWQEWFAQLNIESIQPGRVLISGNLRFNSACNNLDENGLGADYPNAFFCPVDAQPDGTGVQRTGSVILPVQTFADMWRGKLLGSDGVMLGDFTAATIIAHEYGHNVMWRLLKAYDIPESSIPAGNNTELLADCFAGNWAATVFARKDLSIREIAQAAALVIAVGDPGPNMGHGTSFERARALQRGFAESFSQQGQPGNCLKNYWPQILSPQ